MTLEIKDGQFTTMTGGTGDPKNVRLTSFFGYGMDALLDTI